VTPAEKTRSELDAMKGEYLRAQQLVTETGWGMRGGILTRVSELANSYRGESPEKAAFVLGQIKESLRPMEEPLKTIRDYESKKRSVELMETSVP
jgi:hypothetical protein